MKYFFVLATIAMAVICWGVYGPTLQRGEEGFRAQTSADAPPTMQEKWNNSLRAFICVGLAYFGIAVMAPVTMLRMYGERGEWTAGGMLWGLIAGAAGAIGALGVILAFQFGGMSVYVMPLIFGGAPVVNAVLTVYLAKSFKQVGPMFLAGLILVLIGSVTVLLTKPGKDLGFFEELRRVPEMLKVLAAVTVTILAWGVYGPVLHKGQLAMGSSRLRPLVCVGLSYFAIAVVVPALMLSGSEPAGGWGMAGTLWSLTAGAAGALGALGVIMCFNFGGKPVYVMPLVFGGAPVVNTFVTLLGQYSFVDLSPLFYAGLILVCAGAAIVLVFAPRGHVAASAAEASRA